MFVHVVLFWCKDGTESLQQDLIRFAHEEMPQIPSVKHVWAGKSVTSARDVVDSSYHVGLCVIFADKAGHDAYQPHAIHQEFIKRFSSGWTKVKVMDFE